MTFHQPALFRRYCAGSPRVDAKVRSDEQQFADTNAALPAKVAVVVGGLEEARVADLETFCTTLRRRNYAGLDVTLLVMEGESHGSVIARFMTTGWKTIYA